MTRAVLEGVAFGLKDSFELIQGAGLGSISQARVSGGGAKSQLWQQILSDILGVELVTVNTTEGAAYGAAMLAAVGAGLFASVPEACQKMIRITGSTKPSGAEETYRDYYPQYRDLYLLERLDHIRANAAYVGNIRIFAHPEALIYAAAEVFGKVSVDLRGDPVPTLIDVNYQLADFAIVGGDAGGGPYRACQVQGNYCERQFLSIHEWSPVTSSVQCIAIQAHSLNTAYSTAGGSSRDRCRKRHLRTASRQQELRAPSQVLP